MYGITSEFYTKNYNQLYLLNFEAPIIFIKFVCYNFFVLLIIYQGYVLLNVPIVFTGLLFIIDQLFIGSTSLQFENFYRCLSLCMRNNIDKGLIT